MEKLNLLSYKLNYLIEGIYRRTCDRLHCSLKSIYRSNVDRKFPLLSIKLKFSLVIAQIVLRLYLLLINKSAYISAVLFDYSKYEFFRNSRFIDVLSVMIFSTVLFIELLGLFNFDPQLALLGIAFFREKYYRKTILYECQIDRTKLSKTFVLLRRSADLVLGTCLFSLIVLFWWSIALPIQRQTPEIAVIIGCNLNFVFLWSCGYLCLFRTDFWLSLEICIIRTLTQCFRFNAGFLNIKKKNFNCRIIYRFLTDNNELLFYFKRINSHTGSIVTLMIFVGVPGSFLVLLEYLNNTENVVMNSFYLLVILFVFFYLLLFHAWLAQFVTLIKSPSNKLFSLVANFKYLRSCSLSRNDFQMNRFAHSMINIRQRLMIMMKLQEIYSLRAIGFTYTNLGLITLMSFVKFLAVFVKVLLIGYKNFRSMS